MPDSAMFKGFVRLYFDDFLLDCACEMPVDKLKAGEETALKTLENYINEKIIIQVNNRKLTGIIRNVEIENNEVDIDLKYPDSVKPETITIKNFVLTGIYNDQSNMVIVKANEFEEGVKLTPELTERTFKVN
jgi:small nuclear ribonucleoprotein (snRNP)-like protein